MAAADGINAGCPSSPAAAPVIVTAKHGAFYPGLEPRQHRYGTAATFEVARAGFEADWNALLTEIPEGAFDEYRRHRALHAWQETMWAAGLLLPTQVANGR